MYKGLHLFKTAFLNTRRQIFVSGIFLVIITFVLTVILYLAESRVDPDFSFWDAFIWPYEKYIGDPGKMVDEPVISPIAKFVGTLVGIMGVAIFAVPAGLIGSGLTDAMDEEKRERELQDYRHRMHKSFRRTIDKTLRRYLNTLPDGVEKFKKVNLVPQRIPVSRVQLRQGIDLKDIFDTCHEYPEFRLKNLAEAISDEEHPEDRFVVEHYPLNRPYGCCINRQSRVTIVATSSFAECGTGWFTYYLAKFGGLNYVSKDIEVDPDELDSFYNLTDEPLYERRPRADYDAKKDKEALTVLDQKDTNRRVFLHDLRAMATGDDCWVILFTTQIKNSENTFDFHFANKRKNGSDSTVINESLYQQFCSRFNELMQGDYELTSDLQSSRYPLTKNNLGYKLNKQGIRCNTFVLRPSCEIVNFDNRSLLVAFRIAQLLSELLDGSKGVTDDDVKDFQDTGFGYQER